MKWFNAQARANDPKAALITIDGEIGDNWWDSTGVSSQAFMNAVKALGEVTEIQLDLNSPGGAVSDGVAIANYLRQHSARVTVNVLGQASSIASVIASAGDEVNMGIGSWMMVHQPWTLAMGNADQLRALAGDLDTLNDSIMSHYVARVGEEKREEMLSLVKGGDGEGTILSAETAVSLGLADKVMSEVRAAASMTGLAKAMAHGSKQAEAKLKADSTPAPTMAAADVLALAFQLEPAEAEAQAADLGDRIMLALNPTAEYLRENHAQVVTAIEAEARATIDVSSSVNEAMAAERERVGGIIKACQTTGQTQLLEKLVANAMALDNAQEYVYDVAAAASDRNSIHNNHSPEGGHQKGVNSAEIYARRNRAPQA